MLRLATLFWMAVAIAVGLLLYNVKHDVQRLEQQLARTNRAIAEAHERIHVLQAEWSLLNEPERLRSLAERHLELAPMRPSQFVELSAIAALPAAADRSLAGAAPQPAEPQPAARPAAAPRAPEQPPARLAPQREEPLPPPRQAAPQPRRELEAGAPRPLLPPAGAAPRTAPAAPPATPVAVAVPQPAPAAIAAPRPPTGSALGGQAASLPPPVPVRRDGGN